MSSRARTFIPHLPEILKRGDAGRAFALAARGYPADSILPEVMTLFATRNLTTEQITRMSRMALAPDLTEEQALLAGRLSGDMGRLGFSFPQWRGLTRRFNGASLVERFGMSRLYRENDMRDAGLPAADPGRDLFGPGFAVTTAQHYIEYRRAYILCSRQDATAPASLLIRNNSYFFGRDRLPRAVYVSVKPQSIENLQALNADMSGFVDWRAFLASPAVKGEKGTGTLQKIHDLVNIFDDFDDRLGHWLLQDGYEHVSALVGQTATTPMYFTLRAAATPPWYPRHSAPLTPALLVALDRPALTRALKQSGEKLALLSGPLGDFPCKPRSY